MNLSVNGTGHVVVNDVTANVTDSTTGTLFGGVTAATATETNTLATDNFTAINVTGASATVNFIGGSFTDPSNVTMTANNGAVNFTTAASTFGGNLSVTTTTAISQAVAIAGTSASFNAGANTITLTNAANSFTGAVSFTNSGANAVSITNAATLTLGASTMGSGTFTATSTGASSDLIFTGLVSSTGSDTLTAGRNVSFTTGNVSTSGTIGITTTAVAGTVTQVPATSVIAAGTLNVSAGSIGTGGQALVFNATNLTTNTSSANGNQFLADTATVSLAAGALNAGTGTVTLTGGTFQAASTTAFSGGNVTDNATIDLNGNNNSIAAFNGSGTVTDSGGPATLTVTGGGAFSGNITLVTGLTVAGTSQTLTLSGNNSYGSLTTINGGDTLKAGSTTAFSASSNVTDTGTLDLGGFSNSISGLGGSGTVTNSAASGTATLTVTGTGNFSGIISNGTTATTALTVNNGSGTETLSGASANSYTGLTTISGGTLLLSKTANVTAVPGNVSISNGTLTNNASNQFATTTAITETGGLINGNAGSTAQSFASLALSGGTFGTTFAAVTVSGATTVSGTGILNITSGGTSYSTNSLGVTGGNVNIGNNAASTQTLTVGGGGLNYSGGSILVGNSSPGVSGATSKLILNGDVTSSNTVTIGTSANTATETIQVDLGAGAPRNFTVTGALSIAPSIINGALTKLGAGTLILTGANTYSGNTSISAGVLLANAASPNSATGTSTVNVSGTGTLSGSGNITGTVNVNSGGTINPGTVGGVGTLTVGSLAFNGGIYQGDLSGNTSDTIAISSGGTVNLKNPAQGTFNLNNLGGVTSTGTVFTLISNNAAGATAIQNPPFINAAEGSTTSFNSQTAAYSYLSGPGGKNFTLSVVSPWNITAPGGGTNITLQLDSTGQILQELQGATVLNSYSLAAISSVNYTDSSGVANTLTVSYSNGFFNKAVNYFGNSVVGEALVVTGGSFNKVTHTFNTTGPGKSGTILYDVTGTGSSTDLITYSGLAPVNMTGSTIANLIFNLPAGGTGAAISDLGGGTMQIANTSGTAFETTTFVNPTNSLTINRGSATDTLAVTTAMPDLTANLNVGASGSQFGTVTFGGAITLGSGNSVTSFGTTTTVSAAMTTSGAGAISLTAGQTITVSANITGGTGGTTLLASGTAALNTQGITIQSGAVVTATGAGTVSVNGTGGSGSGNINNGVLITGAGSTITSGGGNVQVTGQGGGTGASSGSDGVLANAGTTITSTGAGTVSVTGTGGAGTGGQNIGIHAAGLITSGGNGTVTVMGTGGSGATGAANLGVEADGTVTSGGSGTVTVTGIGGSGASGVSNIGVYVPGTITSGSGAVQVTGTGGPGSGGSNYGVLVVGLISSPNTTLNVTGNVGGATTIGIDLSTAGTAISGGSGNVNLTSNGIINEVSPAIIHTTGTLTTSSSGGTTLTDTNTVSTFNATNTTSGDISFTNSASPLVITGINQTGGGNVIINNTGALTTSTAAITTAANGNITLNASGLATLGASVTAGGTGVVDINAAGVTQTAGIVTASGLRLQGTGTFSMTDANAVGTIAANTTGAILFNNGGTALIVGTVLGTNGITTANNDATLASGALTINQPINVGTANTIRLQSGGAVSQGASGTTTAANLGVNAAGTITLTGATNTINTTFAASTTAGGSISFTDAVGFSTGTVTGNTLFTAVTGVTSAANGNIALVATTGNLTVASGAGVTAGGSGNVNLTTSAATGNININGAVSSTTGTITATSGDNIVFNAGSATTGGNVVLTSNNAAGTVTQTTGSTSVTATSGNLAITAPGGIGSAGQAFVFNVNTLTTDSHTSNGNQFLTDTATAHLAVTNALNAGTGTITLVSGTFQITAGASGGNVNTVSDTSPLIVNSPAVFDLNGRNETVWSLAGNGSVTLGSGTLTTGNSSADTPNFSGVISGTGGVTKVGSDDWTLSGANTYTGTTNVGLTTPSTNGGTLTVTGAINNTQAAAGGVVNLNFAGVTLNGAGTIYGQVTVNASSSGSKTNLAAITISIPSTTGGIGIEVVPGARFVQIGVTGGGVTVNRLTAAGDTSTTGIDVQGSALIENSTIGGATSSVGNHYGIVVDGGGAGAVGALDGVAGLQNDQINNDSAGTATSGATGLYVENSAIVDAGQIAASYTPPPVPNGYYGDITGLFGGGANHSTGGNSFAGYTLMPSNTDLGSPQAIRDENIGTADFARAGVEISNNYSAVGPQLGRMDVTAQGNTWGAGNTTNEAIENLIYHDVDNPSLGAVSYGVSVQNPSVVGTPQYSASFNPALTTAQQGTDTLVPGPQPTGVGHQKSIIRYLKVVYDSFVFLDPNLKTPTTNLGLALYQLNSPYGPAGTGAGATPTLIAGQLSNATYNEANGQYTVIYAFTGPGTEYGSLQDGNYSFQFNAVGIQGGGAGGPSLETTSTAGNPYLNTPALFHRLFGDTQGRGVVDNSDSPSDLALMRQALGSVSPGANYLAYLDFGNTGYIDGADYTAFLRRYSYMLNSDGTVSTDATIPPGTVAPKPLKTTDIAGVLTMTGTAKGVGQLQALEIIRVAGNNYQIIDDATVGVAGLTGGTNFGTFNNVHQINLNLASISENIIINLNGGSLPGNININLGKGNTNPSASPALQVSIIGNGTAADRVGGSVNITGGSGQETVVIGGLPPNDTTTPPNTAVTIGGNVTFNGAAEGGYQGNALTVEAGSTVNSSVYVSHVSTVTIGDYGFAGGAVGGNLIVSDNNAAAAADVAILGRVGGIVSVTGTTGGSVGGDLVAISNNGTGTPGSVGGSVTANIGSGSNSFFMDAGTFLGNALTLLGGSGGNTTQLSGSIGGSVLLNEGNGANSFTMETGSTVGGTLYMLGGNGGNTADLDGTIFGSAYFYLGNGANSVTLDTTGAVDGSSFTYIGGTSSDTVTLDNGIANGFALYVTFLAGNRSLILDPGSTPASAVIDFGVGYGTKTLNYNGQVVTWNQILRNYP